jgi:hypothetical protein
MPLVALTTGDGVGVVSAAWLGAHAVVAGLSNNQLRLYDLRGEADSIDACACVAQVGRAHSGTGCRVRLQRTASGPRP